MQQSVDPRPTKHRHAHGLTWLCTLALACSTPSESVEGATADALTVEDANGGDTSSGTADAAQQDATVDTADSNDTTTLPATCSGSGSKLTCSGSLTPDGVFILHGDGETPSFLPFGATLSSSGAVIVVGRSGFDQQDPFVDSVRSTGLLHGGVVELRIHTPIIPKTEKKWLAGKFGESPKRVTRVGSKDQLIFTSCMEGYQTLDAAPRSFPCWVEWLPDPLSAPIWSLFHIGKGVFDVDEIGKGLLTLGTAVLSTTNYMSDGKVSTIVEYKTEGWFESLKGFWGQEDDVGTDDGDKAALVTLSPTSGATIVASVPDLNTSFPQVATVTNGLLTYVSGRNTAKMVTINLNNNEVKSTPLPGDILSVSRGAWFKGRYYLLVDRGGEDAGIHVVALKPDNSLAWSTSLVDSPRASAGHTPNRGFHVTDHGIVITRGLWSTGIPKTKAVLHFHTLIYALDLNGKLLWSRAVGPLEHKYLSNFALWLPNGHVLTGGRVWRPGYSRLYQGFMAVFDKKGELVPWNKAWPKP